ncbi:MAG: DinB family protein [Mycobacteriales bacterium]
MHAVCPETRTHHHGRYVFLVSDVARLEPNGLADERTSLSGWLDFHRATLLRKCAGLTDEQLRRPMVASGTSLLGLVKHLTEVEHAWFVRTFARLAEPALYSTDADLDADMAAKAEESADELITAYLQACARSRAITAGAASLGDAVPHGRLGQVNLRWILTHMIEETARHNGHADILREQIDGAAGV